MTNILKKVSRRSYRTKKQLQRAKERRHERDLARADRKERAVAHFLYHHAEAVLQAAGKGQTVGHLYWAQDLIRQIEEGK